MVDYCPVSRICFPSQEKQEEYIHRLVAWSCMGELVAFLLGSLSAHVH